MKIHALSTGTVRLKRAFLHARQGWRRQVDLFLPDEWSPPLPIHCWAIEHDRRLLVVDTGETARVRDIPFAKFEVTPQQELPGALAAVGLSLGDVETVVLTHMHGDHIDGGVHVSGPVLVHEEDLAYARSFGARVVQRLLRQPMPPGVDFRGFTLEGGPFGAFPRSRSLSDDGRIVAVDTAGHTPGHISVLCVDDDGRHVLLAGDATDTVEQLLARRADAVAPKPAVSVATMETILAHAQQHPTVYLPSHDPETVARLRDGTVLDHGAGAR
ncbi:MAG: N-acyl homoserine lactonase family protein [Solirubrobacteraceae bacterium]